MIGDALLDPLLGERLLRWLEQGGAHLPALAIHRRDDGQREVHARAPIPAGKPILTVPLPYLLTADLARASPIGARIAASSADEGDHIHLAAYLLEEQRAPTSFWRPYLDVLPTSYRHLPFFFDDHEISLLRGSFTLEKIRARREALAGGYERLCRRVRGFDRFSYLDFVWARSVVTTRVFSLTVDGHKTCGLVPLADLLNHQGPGETRYTYTDPGSAFVMTALRGFAAGDAIHDNYGAKCNSRFFVNYGFALEDNDANEAEIRLPDARRGHRVFHVPARYDAAETQRMLSFLRLQAGRRAGPGGTSAPRGVAREEAALQALAAACRAMLAGFETTMEEDDARLRDPGLPPNVRSAVVMRRGEKRVLRAFLDFAVDVAPLLRLPRAERHRLSAKRSPGGAAFAGYLEEAVFRRSP